MRTINISDYNDSLVLYLGGKKSGVIDAYSLANCLINFSDAIKETNDLINSAYDIEIIVLETSPGSFKIKLKTILKPVGKIFSVDGASNIALGVISTLICQALFPQETTTVNIYDDRVVIEQGDSKIIVPRDVHEQLEKAKRSERIKKSISRTFHEIKNDPEIISFGITKNINDKIADIDIPRNKFSVLINDIERDEKSRIIFENAELQIKTAVLQRLKKKWEFVWRGINIKAPILDKKFYDDFYAHEIKIAPGDVLKVRLAIYQELDEDLGIYINKKYEVEKVHSHEPKLIQDKMHL